MLYKYKYFVEQNRKVDEKLIKQGSHYSRLCKYFKKFIKIHYYVFNKYDMYVKYHICDGICSVLRGLSSLNKNSTIMRLHKHNTVWSV